MRRRVVIALLAAALVVGGVAAGLALLPRLAATTERVDDEPVVAREEVEEEPIKDKVAQPVTMTEAPTRTSTTERGLTVTAPEAFLESSELAEVEDEIAALEEDGVTVSVVLLDLETRRGVTYEADRPMYPASCIKASYCTWIYESHGSAAGMSDTVSGCLLYSSNEDYHALLEKFGLSAYTQWLKAHGATEAAKTSGTRYYPYISANELSSIWQEIHRYGTSEEAGADELVGYLSQTTNSPIAETLRDGNEVWSKAGWYPADGTGLQTTNDAGVIFSDTGAYVMVVMTNMSSNLEGLKPLIRALDAAHTLMCGNTVAYYE